MNGLVAVLATAGGLVFVHLVQTTVVVAIVATVARLAHRAPGRWLFAVWAAAMVKLLLPLAVGSRATAAGLEGSGLAPIVVSGAAARWLASSDVSPGAAGSWVVFAVTIAWVLGAAVGLARVARACAVAPGHLAAPSPARARRLERAIASTNVPPARVVVVADGTVPHTAGLVHPRIHVPIAVIDELTVAELRAVLLHENAHRVRRDPLLSLALGIVGAVFFFYPIAAFLGRRLREAAELVCDEAAIRGGASPAALASGLARVVRLSMSPSPQLASPALGGSLSRRLDRLDTIRRKRPMLRHFSLVLLALAIVLTASAAPLVTAEEKPAVEITKPPTVIHQVAPEMPESALADRTEGRVVLRATVAKTGEPRDVLVEQGVEGRPEFENAALEAMSQWKFTAAEADGEVVEMQILVPFLFRHDH